ncbi:MAG: hypothetical protein LBD06_12615 [Candidatus Accumulibacter sp.]|jgi:hypothetical protein|nr:hypothetical protein [Accumulibacter sp.]
MKVARPRGLDRDVPAGVIRSDTGRPRVRGLASRLPDRARSLTVGGIGIPGVVAFGAFPGGAAVFGGSSALVSRRRSAGG